MKCELCGQNSKEYTSWKALSSHIRQFHNVTSKEYYDLFLKKPDEGICANPNCNNPTKFKKLSLGYHKYCSKDCSNNCPSRAKQISESLKNNEEHIKKSTERLISYNKSEKGRANSSRVGKITGGKSFKIAHEKYDGVKFCEKCNQDTMHIIGIGCISCFNKSEEHKKSILNTIKQKYGKQFVNVYQVPEIKNKIKEISLERYGCENPGNSREARIKAAKTMHGNGNDSSWEDYFEKQLISLNIEYKTKYNKDLRYPFQCDFYLPATDTFIEINGYWSHGKHFFNINNIDDIETLHIWQTKANIGHKQYQNAINVWTKKDILKRETAEKNNLNYIVLWSLEDIDNYIEELQKMCDEDD